MDVPVRLYRVGELVHLQRFIEEGEILFRPLSYYRKIEDSTRHDEFDGLHAFNVDGGKLSLINPVTGLTEGNWDLVGHSTYGDHAGNNVFVCCFSTAQISFEKPNLEIFDVAGLMNALEPLISERNLQPIAGRVRYYNESLPLESFDEGMSWLKKRQSFSREREFRIGFFDSSIEIAAGQAFRFGPLKRYARLTD